MTQSLSDSPETLPQIEGYRLLEQLYFGTRTIVYRALEESQQQSVAIKILRNEYPNFNELVQFRNQYTIAKNLAISGIVRPFKLETVGHRDALIMEDFGGIALGKYARQQSLNLTEILEIAIQIAAILRELHQHSVIHKDLKPDNILIHPESKKIKIIDFSIASLLPKETPEIKNPNILEGTLAYLAPEQTGRMNRGIDYRADFYAFGVTLYQLLTETLPFVADDPLELVHCHIAKTPISCDRVNPEIPGMVAAIVAKLMAKNAEDRYQSAIGLQYDLQQCLTQLTQTGQITEFQLGQQDPSDRFLIPEKLYGRQTEVQTLLNAFERVAAGAAELMLVAGFSGIGKTAVINEVHKPIVRQRGYFIKGKFDQFNRNVPLSAFVQALQDLMAQLQSESDAKLAQWKSKILEAVGENGQVLIEVIPEIERMIGEQPAAPELSGNATQNRFNLLFQKFIGLFTTAEHPLVIFLDDLQWADSASLKLMKVLMEDKGHLLILGAYRDNEVSPNHPFILTVEDIQKAGAILNRITLEPLSFEDTNHLVADTLRCSQEFALPLSDLVDRKTKGNPFFTTQFLKALHEDGHIRFVRDRHYWECDIARVSTLSLADDVVEFTIAQLHKLPPTTQSVLKLAACIGNQFDLQTLAIVSEQSQTAAATALWKALQEGLVLPASQVYKFFQDSQECDTAEKIDLTYRFLHDRVQQAAYCLIADDLKQQVHCQIGQLLLDTYDESESSEKIFDLVNHLNFGQSFLPDGKIKQTVAQLNLIAGQKALTSTAYEVAVGYFETGLKLSGSDPWIRQPEFTLSLYRDLAAAQFCNTQYEAAEATLAVALKNIDSPIERVEFYDIQILLYTVQNLYNEAVQAGLAGLEALGFSIDLERLGELIAREFEAIHQLLKDRSLSSLLNSSLQPEPTIQAIVKLFVALDYPLYNSAQKELHLLSVLIGTRLSIQHGNVAESAKAYANYGFVVGLLERQYQRGYEFGELAVELSHQFNSKAQQCKAQLSLSGWLHVWVKPMLNVATISDEAYQAGVESGELQFAYSNLFIKVANCLFQGRDLNSIAEDIEKYEQLVEQRRDNFLAVGFAAMKVFVRNLCPDPSPQKNEVDLLEARAKISEGEASKIQVALCVYYILQLHLYCIQGNCERGSHYLQLAEDLLPSLANFTTYGSYFYYSSLMRWQLYESCSDSEKEESLKKIQANQEQLQIWAKSCSENFLHKYLLVAAECERVFGNKAEAIEKYDLAIAEAKKNSYVHEEALANELAAKFYFNWGKPKIARDYLSQAYYCYSYWGAKTKVQDLERTYPELLAPMLQQQSVSLALSEITASSASLTTLQALKYYQSSTSPITNTSILLDLATILKASQTLSGEIELDKLLATLLRLVLENAGADKGALLMPKENEWFIEAFATVEQPVQIQSIPLSGTSEISKVAVNSVSHSLQPIAAADIALHPLLLRDFEAMEQPPKSLLCTPILQQGKAIAILYMENRVTADAFTEDRIQLLNLLCAQAAISLENARLYQQAQQYAQQLEESQLQIVQSEKMASLGNLVAGVAHEINNPVGFLNGSISNASDYFQDLLEYLELYQECHPDAAPDVIEKAEEIDLEFLCEDFPKLLDSMTAATNRISGISNSLRTFSRADTVNFASVDIHEGLDSTLLILKYRLKANDKRPAIQIIKKYGELPQISCFPGQLNQVFMNILANAIDVFDEAAQTSSYAELEANPQRIELETEVLGENEIALRIRDNGKGMPEEVKVRIFDHLFTTKEVGKGTGLGLAIARQIVVEKHRGSLEVESELNRGTEFCLCLPIQQE